MINVSSFPVYQDSVHCSNMMSKIWAESIYEDSLNVDFSEGSTESL
jgi:hypothetical protein